MARRVAYRATLKNSKEVYDFMRFTLILLGWIEVSTGVETGFKKGKHFYWFCDDGAIEYIIES